MVCFSIKEIYFLAGELMRYNMHTNNKYLSHLQNLHTYVQAIAEVVSAAAVHMSEKSPSSSPSSLHLLLSFLHRHPEYETLSAEDIEWLFQTPTVADILDHVIPLTLVG